MSYLEQISGTAVKMWGASHLNLGTKLNASNMSTATFPQYMQKGKWASDHPANVTSQNDTAETGSCLQCRPLTELLCCPKALLSFT